MQEELLTQTIPFLVVMIAYIGLMAYIGYYATQKTRTFSDYLTMSGKAGAILSGLAYFATQYSMSTFMGVPGTIYHVATRDVSVRSRHRVQYAHSRTAGWQASHSAWPQIWDAYHGGLSFRPL